MKLALIGRLEDGSPLSPTQSTSVATTIKIPMKADVTLSLSIKPPMGKLIVLTDRVLTLTVKKRPTDGILLQKIATIVDKTTAEFKLAPNDFKKFLVGRYIFDIWMTSVVDEVEFRDQVMPVSGLMLVPSVS